MKCTPTVRATSATLLIVGLAATGCSSGTRAVTRIAGPVSISGHVDRAAETASSVNEWSPPEMVTQIDEVDDNGCSNALYWADEPLSATMTPVSTEEAEKMCNERLITCFRQCMNNPKPPWPAQKKGDRSHHEHCNKKCNGAYRACLQKAGLLQTFAVMDAALAWIKSHGKEIVGTMVVIGGVIYVVSTGGSGALVLVVL